MIHIHKRCKLLRALINSLEFPIHCAGCDEWGCGGVEKSGAFHTISNGELQRLDEELLKIYRGEEDQWDDDEEREDDD